MCARYSLCFKVAIVGTLSLACSPSAVEDSEASSRTVRDSAGIRIVDNYMPAWPADGGWTIGPEPVLEIGVADGDPQYMLFAVTDAVRMSDGRVAIVNSGSQEVRFFEPTGDYAGAIGGPGEGPGEFKAPWKALRAAGDSIVVWDMGFPGSLNVFDETGRFAARTPIDRARLDGAMPGWFAEGGELLPDGTFLLHLFNREDSGVGRKGVYRTERGWIRAPADASRIDTIGFFPGSEQFGYEFEGRVTSNGRPFGASTLVTGGGNPVRIVAADNSRYEIRVYSGRGQLETLVRRSYDPVPVTDEDIRQMEDQYRSFAERAPEARRGSILKFLDVVDHADTKPVLGVMSVDYAGFLWVFEPERFQGDLAYSVFDPDGAWLGRVTMPRPFQMFEIGPDYILGSQRNELGVETVVMYELRRS